jgi:hypothetical protein
MTAGSAASLPRHAEAPGAPLSLFRMFSEATHLIRSLPPAARPAEAIADPPRGRIVLVGKSVAIPLTLLRALRDSGWALVGPAASVPELGRVIGRQMVDCAIIDLDNAEPRTAADAAALLARNDIPVVFLAGSTALPEGYDAGPLVQRPCTAEALLRAIERVVSDRYARQEEEDAIQYPIAPETTSWPRVMPQL